MENVIKEKVIITLIKKVCNNAMKEQIYRRVLVSNNTMYGTDTDIYFKIKGLNYEDGLYEIAGSHLVRTDLPVEGFPKCLAFKSFDTLQINFKDWKELNKYIAKDPIKRALGGIGIDKKGFTATNSKRLLHINKANKDISYVIPASISKVLNIFKKDFMLEVSEDLVLYRITLPGIEIISHTLDSVYPLYWNVINPDNLPSISLNVKEFKEKNKELLSYKNKTSFAKIVFNFSTKTVELVNECQTWKYKEELKFSEEIDIEKTVLSLQFLQDVLTDFSEEVIKIQFSAHNHPIQIEVLDRIYVIMPIDNKC